MTAELIRYGDERLVGFIKDLIRKKCKKARKADKLEISRNNVKLVVTMTKE